MMPPSRRVAFNAELQEDDGLLASSLCRREKLTYGEAASYIRRQVEYINDLLLSDGEIPFGNLGVFVSRDGAPVRFYPWLFYTSLPAGEKDGRFPWLLPSVL